MTRHYRVKHISFLSEVRSKRHHYYYPQYRPWYWPFWFYIKTRDSDGNSECVSASSLREAVKLALEHASNHRTFARQVVHGYHTIAITKLLPTPGDV